MKSAEPDMKRIKALAHSINEQALTKPKAQEGGMSDKQKQIEFFVDWYFDDRTKHQCGPHLAYSNMSMIEAFHEKFGNEISDSVVKSRIRDAAKELGLTGQRRYYEYGEAWTRWEVIYS